MGKRLYSERGKEARPAKRRKFGHDDQQNSQTKDPPGVIIRTQRDLRDLLTFQQDDSHRLRLNLQKFRHFLEEFWTQYAGNGFSNGSSEKSSLLLGFLNSSTPSEDDHNSNSLPDLMQAWSFASQVNDNSLLSMIPNTLALLLRTISSCINFQSVGSRLCRTILKEDNITLLDKGLSASGANGHLIMSCLGLLIEIASFDGGSLVRRVYNQRNVTFKRLDVFLNMRAPIDIVSEKGSLENSVRSYAFKYVLINIRYLDKVAKADFLSYPRLVKALLLDVVKEAPDLISEFLAVIKANVLLDESFPRSVKNRIFIDTNLKQIATLFNLEGDAHAYNDEQLSIPDRAQELVRIICTSRRQGIVYKQDGWYPPGMKEKAAMHDKSLEHDFSPALTMFGEYSNKVPVRNTTLASFLQDLRPWASIREKEIALAIFHSAPELVADYFKRKQPFSFDPRLSTTWIGYSGFLLAVVSLPLPTLDMFQGSRVLMPPPVSIIMESIVPAPLTQKVMKMALNHSSKLVRLCATRILVAILQKLEKLSAHFDSMDAPPQWKAMVPVIAHRVQTRISDLGVIVNLFGSCVKERSVLRDALVYLLTLYHKVAPEMSGGQRFDVSNHLTDTLFQRLSEINQNQHLSLFFELNCLIEMANYSLESRWWQKSSMESAGTQAPSVQLMLIVGNLSFSPFTSIIRIITQTSDHYFLTAQSLLQNIVEEYHVLQCDRNIKSLQALVQSFRTDDSTAPDNRLFEFFDNCILRLVQKPLGYFGDAEAICAAVTTKGPLSNLFIVIAEQWPFFCKAHSGEEIENLASWISRYLESAAAVGENREALLAVCHAIQPGSTCAKASALLETTLKDEKAVTSPRHEPFLSSSVSSPDEALERMIISLNQGLQPSPEPKEYPALSIWAGKDVGDAIEDFDIGNLLLYLSSEHEEIRRQAIIQLQSLMSRLEASKYDYWLQFYLLAGIVVETAKTIIATKPLPSIASSIAAKLSMILRDPLHCLYGKANHFLNRSPVWNLAKIPSYWIDKIFLSPPEQDEVRYQEIHWLLDTLILGLRNTSDLDLYRSSSVFERTMSLVNSPRLPKVCFEKAIHLLYRASLIGGATTLITRCGVLGWVQLKRSQKVFDDLLLQSFDCKVRRESNVQTVLAWTGDHRT